MYMSEHRPASDTGGLLSKVFVYTCIRKQLWKLEVVFTLRNLKATFNAVTKKASNSDSILLYRCVMKLLRGRL